MEEHKLLLIASTGGHLSQLVRLAPSLGASSESLWVTFDNEQSRSMLKGRRVLFVPYVAPRDWIGVIRARRLIASQVKRESFAAAYSTGAGLALAAFSILKLGRTPKTYIESVSRTDGPSLTGKIIAIFRLASLRTQHAQWARGRWILTDGVLDEYETQPKQASEGKGKVFVTLGTIRPYRFDALVDAILKTGMVGHDTVWQVGVTQRKDLPGRVVDQMPSSEFETTVRQADAVITHAGVGTILQLLDMGVSPVVVPRSRRRGEHVDDHQQQIAKLLIEKEIGIVVDAASLTDEHLRMAMTQETVPARRQV